MRLRILLGLCFISKLSSYCWGQECIPLNDMIPTSTKFTTEKHPTEDLCCGVAVANGHRSFHIYQNGTEENPEFVCDYYLGDTFTVSLGNKSFQVYQTTSPPTTTTMGTDSTSTATTPTPAPTTTPIATTPTTPAPFPCPDPISELLELHPHPYDCRKYILCENGIYRGEQQCGPGTLFDFINRQCKPAPEAICAPDATTPTNAPVTTTTPQPAPCPPTGEVKIPHQYDCRKFYYCVNGVGYETRCEEGTLFDFVERLCLPTEMAKCSPGATTPLPVTCVPDGTTYYEPHPSDCRRYIMCVNGLIDDRPCPNNYLFDHVDKTCKPGPEARCAPGATTPAPIQSTTPDPISCPPQGRFKLPHPYDCRKYYYCVEGSAFPETCPTRFLFDRILLECVSQESVNCFPGATTETTTPTTHETTTETTTHETTTPTTTTSTTPTTTSTTTTLRPTTTFSPPEVVCPDEGRVLIPHPYDCTQYFECLDGVSTQMKCLYYNEVFDYITLQCVRKVGTGAGVCYPGATMPPPPFGGGTNTIISLYVIPTVIILGRVLAN